MLHRHAEEVLAGSRAVLRRCACGGSARRRGRTWRGRAARRVAKRGRRQPDERTDIGREAILVRAIAIDVRLRLRPRAIEQRQEAMMEEIEEPAERRDRRLTQSLARVLGDVQRQRSVRTEQAEEPHLQPRTAAVASGLERGQRRRRERQIRILAEADRLRRPDDGRAPSAASTRTDTRAAAASGRSRAGTAPPPARRTALQRRSRAPLWHPSVDLAPAQRSQDGLRERVDRHVAGKKCASTEPSRNALPPSNASSSTSTVISRPRPNARRGAATLGARLLRRRRHAADDRMHAHRTDAVDLLPGADVAARGVELQEIAQRRRPFLLRRVHERQVVERQVADRPPRDAAVGQRRERAAGSARSRGSSSPARRRRA